MPHTRLVGFLGTGDYERVHYQLDSTIAQETSYFLNAIGEFYRADPTRHPVGLVVVLGTDEAIRLRIGWNWVGANGCIDRRAPFVGKLALGESVPCLVRQVPSGEERGQQWRLFQHAVEALQADAIASFETMAPAEIVLDVTHGYRVQPMLGAAALSFVLSEWAREQRPSPPAVRMLYGAYEARKKDPAIGQVAPVWDLTEFVQISRWNAALDAFIRFGRADDLEQLARSESKRFVGELRAEGRTGPELRPANFPREFGAAVRRVANDLVTVRLRSLFCDSVPELIRVLDDQQTEAFLQRLPLLRPSLQELRKQLVPLQADTVLQASGVRACAALAGFYGRLQRFSEQAVVIREGLVSQHGLALGRPSGPDPGQKGCSAARQPLDQEWGANAHRVTERLQQGRPLAEALQPIAPAAHANVQVALQIQDPRNDLEHAGIRDQPTSADSLINSLKVACVAFEQLLHGQGARST